MANYQPEMPWLHQYPEGVGEDITGLPLPVFALLDEAVLKFPDKPAMHFMGKEFTYLELGEAVDAMAAGLQHLGVKHGTRVGLFLPNCPQFIISYYAVLKAGGTVVNYNPLYTVGELKHQVEDSKTEVMITLNLTKLYSKVNNLMQTTALEKVIVARLQDVLPFPKNLLFPIAKRKEIASVLFGRKNISFNKLLKKKYPLEPVGIDIMNDPAVLQYTGGTTGVSKGAVLTHSNLYSNVMQIDQWFHELEEGKERIMAVIPLFHAFAMTAIMNLGIHKGSCIILHPRFDLTTLIYDLQHQNISVMLGVPSIYVALNTQLQKDSAVTKSLKLCIAGGAPLPKEVQETFEHVSGCSIIEGYGLTETSPVACVNPVSGKHKIGSVGMPLPGTIVKIEDMEKEGKFLPFGKEHVGHICIAGPQLMKEYLNNPEATAESIKEGFLRTGDLGYIDEEGYVFIVDRLKEMIITSGYNVYPRHIEEALYQHHDVKEAAVIGIEDAFKGQVPKAFVVLKAGEECSEGELKSYLEKKLAPFAVPASIEFREELPKTLIGKIDKKAL